MALLEESEMLAATVAEDLIPPLWSGLNLRYRKLYLAYGHLVLAALENAQTPAQALDQINSLFSTYITESFEYFLLETSSLADVIQADVLPWHSWLDVIYPSGSGVTLRTRLFNQLSP